MDDANSIEYSEFSMYELLYMGHEGLTYIVETMLDETFASDPFDAIAALEEQLGSPLALLFPRRHQCRSRKEIVSWRSHVSRSFALNWPQVPRDTAQATDCSS